MTRFEFLCPTAAMFERQAAAKGFTFMKDEDQSIIIRRGSISGRFTGGGRHSYSQLTLNPMPHASERDLDTAVSDLSRAFPTLKGVA